MTQTYLFRCRIAVGIDPRAPFLSILPRKPLKCGKTAKMAVLRDLASCQKPKENQRKPKKTGRKENRRPSAFGAFFGAPHYFICAYMVHWKRLGVPSLPPKKPECCVCAGAVRASFCFLLPGADEIAAIFVARAERDLRVATRASPPRRGRLQHLPTRLRRRVLARALRPSRGTA